MNKLVIPLVIALILVSCTGTTDDVDDEGVLYPFKSGGMWGYLDRDFNIVVPAEYVTASPFSDGIGLITLNREFDNIQVTWKKGFVNSKGKVIECRSYESVSDFSEGLARIVDDGRGGYINKRGMMVIKPQFRVAHDFAEGLAAVLPGGSDKLFGFINKEGKLVIPAKFKMTWGFSEGLAFVGIDSSGALKFGYIDKFGLLVIPPKYDFAEDFSEGLAAVGFGEYPNRKSGYIDKTGTMVIEPQFDDAHAFHEGLAAVKVGEKWGFIDKEGNMVIKPEYGYPWRGFSEDLARVPVGDLGAGKYGYIDKTGELVIDAKFTTAFDFNDGIAMVSVDMAMGYIDKTGEFLWGPME